MKIIKTNKQNLIFLSIILTAIIFGFFYTRHVWNKSINQTSLNAIKLAETSEIGFSSDEVKKLHVSPEDIGTLNYESIKSRLMKLPVINKDIRFAYIYTEKEGKIYFLADSEPSSSKDYSPPGQEYTEAEDESKLPFTEHKTILTSPSSDRWGTWVSVYVPMVDFKTGEVYAVFGMDYPAANWDNEAFSNTIQISIIILFIIILLIVLNFTINSNSKVKQSEQIYQKLVNSIPDGYILLFDKDLRYIIAGGPELEKSNLDKIKILGKTFRDVYPKDIADILEPIYNKALLGEQSIFEMQYKDYIYSHRILPIVNNDGTILMCIHISTNITEQKKAGEDFKKHNEELFKFNKLMVGRELEMIDLKKQLSDLKK